jgi:molecular chaperone Hsp33
MTDIAPKPPTVLDDVVTSFQIEGLPVRGRVVRLGAAVDEVLTRHDYPEPVANLLGEACALAALVGSSLKFEGRLIIQAQGDGPVRYVVVDYDTSGGLRGYCRFDADEVAKVSEGFVRPGAKTLLGGGVFIMTLDQGRTWTAIRASPRSRARPWPCAPSSISTSPNRPRPACAWPSARPIPARA